MRFLLFFFLISSFFAQAQSYIDPSLLNEFSRKEKVGFIVLLSEQADLSKIPTLIPKRIKGQMVFDALRQKTKTQEEIINIINAAHAQHRSFLMVNAIYVKGDLVLAKQLANRSDVKTVMYDAPVKVEDPITVDYINVQNRTADPEWGLKMIKADSVWLDGIKGAGVVIAGQDTGYDWEHPAIKDKYRGNGDTPVHDYNWHDAIHTSDVHYPDSIPNPCGFDVSFPCNDHPHGTHTIGTMVGLTEDKTIGVAPEAKWIGCRNMDRGWGTPASYIECFEFFLAPTDLNGNNPDVNQAPHVINNSWACPEVEGCNPENFEIMEMVVNNLKAAGIVVVVSAGNSGGNGCSSIVTPAAIYENSFSVGATRLVNDSTAFVDSIASFSSRGPVNVDGSGRLKPNVSAPGQAVLSCIPGNKYAAYSGTSMAGPHVAGAVALIISANHELAGLVDTIEYILETTADKKQAVDTCGGVPGNLIPNNTHGFGRINVYKAVQLAQSIQISGNPTEVLMTMRPNPTSEQLEVILKGDVKGKLFFYDLLGQLVQYNTIHQIKNTIDVSHFVAGTYFVLFTSPQHQEVKKLIIQ